MNFYVPNSNVVMFGGTVDVAVISGLFAAKRVILNPNLFKYIRKCIMFRHELLR